MAMASDSTIFQFNVSLMDITPMIWRRIQVPSSYNFRELHFAIQCAMGWQSVDYDYHMHSFEIIHPRTSKNHSISIPFPGDKVKNENKTLIADYFSMSNKGGNYMYDYGAGWIHELFLEEILPAEADTSYPKCLAGARACPPEDSGVTGYYWICEAIADPNHPDRNDKIEWLEGLGYTDYNPEEFNPMLVTYFIKY